MLNHTREQMHGALSYIKGVLAELNDILKEIRWAVERERESRAELSRDPSWNGYRELTDDIKTLEEAEEDSLTAILRIEETVETLSKLLGVSVK